MPGHVASILALILERPLCVGCVVTKTGLNADDFHEVVATIGKTMLLHRTEGQCPTCGRTGAMLSAERPAG